MSAVEQTATETAEEKSPALHFFQDLKWRLLSEGIWIVLVLVLIAILVVANIIVASPHFFSESSLRNIVSSLLPVLMVIGPMILVMAAGGLDLSVGAVAGFVGVVVAQLAINDMPLILAVFIGLILAFMIGLVNALLVGLARINGTVVTLGMLWLLQGISLLVAKEAFLAFRGAEALSGGLVGVIWWAVALLVTLICAALALFTPFGRRPQPGDDDQESWWVRALYTGGPYLLSSLMAGFAGLALLGRIRAAQVAGYDLQFNTILAALIGGTPLGGGFGFVIAGVFGALAASLVNFLSQVIQIEGGMSILFVKGIVFVIATLLAHLYYRGVAWQFTQRKDKKAEEDEEPQEEVNTE